VPGVPLGLSPIAYAAWTIGGYLSAQQFGLEWFTVGRHPAGAPEEHRDGADDETERTGRSGSSWHAGRAHAVRLRLDWEIDLLSVQPNESQFLETMGAGMADIARFFRMPADVLEGATTKGTVVYANISQRSVYLLQMFLGGSIKRRERMLSTTLPKPRNVHLDTDVLMRLDPQTLVAVQAPRSRTTRSRRPRREPTATGRRLTPEQLAEFDQLARARLPVVMPADAVPTEGATQ
jgi:phage portal protein BeeE